MKEFSVYASGERGTESENGLLTVTVSCVLLTQNNPYAKLAHLEVAYLAVYSSLPSLSKHMYTCISTT